MRRFVHAAITSAALASLSLGLAPATRGEGPAREKVLVGYLFGSPKDVNYALYTHLCHAFATAGPDGKLNPNRSVPSRSLTTQAHAAGVKVLISLGGWGWDDQFRAIVAAPEAEARYVEAVVKMVDEFDYDGVDLDWEYPDRDDEVPGFERLTRTFRTRLDAIGRARGRNMLVTMAASSNYETFSRLDTAFLVETMDWINVMTYDFAGDWSPRAGHNSPLFASSKDGPGGGSSERSMLDFLEKRGVPADRLALGLALYGRGFHVREPYTSTRGVARKSFSVDYKAAAELLAEGWKRTLDEETKVPWLASPDGSQVVGYDDAESIRLKTEWALSKGFRGVFFWQVDGDRMPDGSNPLQQSARKAWESGRVSPR